MAGQDRLVDGILCDHRLPEAGRGNDDHISRWARKSNVRTRSIVIHEGAPVGSCSRTSVSSRRPAECVTERSNAATEERLKSGHAVGGVSIV